MQSLRIRLAIGSALAIAAALVVAGFGLVFLFDRHAVRALSGDLDVYLRELSDGLIVDGAGGLSLTHEPADPRFGEPLSGLYWQITDPRGTLLRSRSLWDTKLGLDPAGPLDPAIRRTEIAGPAGGLVLVAERAITIADGVGERPVRVATAAALDQLSDARSGFILDLAPALTGLALVLALAAYVQIGLGLRPLDRVRAGVAAVRSRDLDRLPEDVPLEVRPLTDELNALLDAQEAALRRARTRAGDLAHGLKTPLAALAGDAERLRQRGEIETAADIEAIGTAMLRHVDRELARARLSGQMSGTGNTLVRPAVLRLIATIARTPAGGRLGFDDTAVAVSAMVPFDPDDLIEVLGNLLENAARYAEATVRVTTEPKGAAAGSYSCTAIIIEDDGPGVADEARQLILERGNRLDLHGPGAGLGLAIVQEALEHYDWRLELGRSPLGGLLAAIRLGRLDVVGHDPARRGDSEATTSSTYTG